MGCGSSKSKQTEEEKYGLDTNDPTINIQSYPKKNFGLTITLSDNRKLGYMIYGVLRDCKATIILLPGSPGTRLFNHDPHDKINKLYGIRMIILDRPGIGLSSPHYNYTFKTYSNDIYELVSKLELKTYHIVGYSAGGPFGCVYSSIYSNNNINNQYKLKSFCCISGVGPCNTPSAYGQMTLTNKLGWFIVNNASNSVINFVAKQESKGKHKKPIKSLINDFSYCKYDGNMIKKPQIIKSFLISKHETYKTDNYADNRLIILYGLSWNIKFDDIKCPFIVYNGTVDYGCVPNMARFIFESVSGKKAPDIPVATNNTNTNTNANGNSNDAINLVNNDNITNDNVPNNTNDNKADDQDDNPITTSSIAVDVGVNNDDLEEKNSISGLDFLNVDKTIWKDLEDEYNQNDQLNNVKNKQSKLIWGKDKGHLWFFEEEIWKDVVSRVLFFEQK